MLYTPESIPWLLIIPLEITYLNNMNGCFDGSQLRFPIQKATWGYPGRPQSRANPVPPIALWYLSASILGKRKWHNDCPTSQAGLGKIVRGLKVKTLPKNIIEKPWKPPKNG